MIRRFRPQVELSSDPYRRHLWHRDHRIIGQVVMDALFPYARDHMAYPAMLTEGLEPHKVREVLFYRAEVVDTGVIVKMGATIVNRALTDLFRRRGVVLEMTYQLNTGGNTDFLKMLDRTRLVSKKESKTEAVQSVAAERLAEGNIHIGPSDYVPWQKDNKIGFIRMEGKIFGDVAIDLEMRLSVEDSPNSAGVVIDMIRCVRLALDRGISGALPLRNLWMIYGQMASEILRSESRALS